MLRYIVLESNRSLQILNVRSKRIGSIEFDRIAKSLESNTSLRKLYLHGKTSENRKLKVQAIHRIRQQKGLHPVHISIM